jgi:hypothetical protein
MSLSRHDVSATDGYDAASSLLLPPFRIGMIEGFATPPVAGKMVRKSQFLVGKARFRQRREEKDEKCQS